MTGFLRHLALLSLHLPEFQVHPGNSVRRVILFLRHVILRSSGQVVDNELFPQSPSDSGDDKVRHVRFMCNQLDTNILLLLAKQHCECDMTVSYFVTVCQFSC